MMAFPAVALYLVLLWLGGTVGKPIFDWWFGVKLFPLIFMNGYSLPLSIALAGTITVLLVFLGYKRVLGLTRPAIFIGSGFLIAYPLIPTSLRQLIHRNSPHYCNDAHPTAFMTVNWRSKLFVGRRNRSCMRHSYECSDRRVGLVRLPFGLCRDYPRFGCFALIQRWSRAVMWEAYRCTDVLCANFGGTLCKCIRASALRDIWSAPVRKVASKSRLTLRP
jgi:hypothetical protein